MAYKTGTTRPVGSDANPKINVASGRDSAGRTKFGALKVTRKVTPSKAKELASNISKSVKSGDPVGKVNKTGVTKTSKFKTTRQTLTTNSPAGTLAASGNFVNRVMGVIGRQKGK